MTIRDNTELVDHRLCPVDNRGGVGALVRVDPDGEQGGLLSVNQHGWCRGGTLLMRVVARACFEPHHGESPAAGHFAQRPTDKVDRAFLRPATEPSDAKRRASTQPSGHYALVDGMEHGLSAERLE